MADSTGALIGFLLESTKEFIQYNGNLLGGLNDNIRELLSDMEAMKVFVREFTEKYADEESMESLATQVEDVVFQAEDTIEKYFVYLNRQKHRRTLDKTIHFPQYLIDLRRVGQECLQVSEKMKMLYQHKVPIAREIGSIVAGRDRKRRTDTAVEDNIIGFEDVAEDVKKLLKGGSEKLEVHSIVGMVGLGKTTLARKVYLDHDIEYNFFARAFVNVSQVYDKKKLFLKILGHFIAITDEIIKMHIDSIRDKIIEELEGKQYLIVLDDVWEEKVWDELKEAFPNNEKNSRVLITTRSSNVARYTNKSLEPYALRFMRDEESKKLLRWKIFGELDCPSDLEKQIKKYESLILEKCKGLPLAIVVVAGILLIRKHRVDWWKKVWDRVNNSEHVIEKLSTDLIRFSFDNLPYYMKPCYLYLGAFPDGFDIPVWKLFRLWTAEGFIQGKGNPEDIAERYLEEFVDRNLVMVAESKWNGQIKRCRVHDFLREFCKNEAIKRNIFQEMKGTTPTNTKISMDDYLRIVINSDVLDYTLSKPSGKRVRSFLSFSKNEVRFLAQQVPVLPKAFQLLRVFDARAVNFKTFPADLCYLILLKYVAMSCDIDVVTPKLSYLGNLQTFIFETKSPTVNFKADLWQMVQLRHVHINTSTTIFVLPPPVAGAGTKSKLQTLTTIAPESCTKEVFDRCKDLKKLGIRGKLAEFVDRLFANIARLEFLENLKLLNNDANVSLPYLPEDKNFTSMKHLNKLTLYRTSLGWEHMSTLGKLENLMILKLKDSAFVGDFWTVTEKGFPNLSVLHIDKTNLLEWEASSAQFPLLATLILKYCDRLTGIPSDFEKINSFQKIDLHWTNPKVVASAREIKKEKKYPKVSVYPPDN